MNIEKHRYPRLGTFAAFALHAAIVAAAVAAPAGDFGFDFVTIGDPGNPAYDGRFNDPFTTGLKTQTIGRGRVDHVFRISRTEVTTGQWLEFFNTFATQSAEFDTLLRPIGWAAKFDTTFSGPGVRFELSTAFPDPARIAVAGMSWRQAAMFANWLHNGRSSDPASLLTGAYDTSTFGFDPATGRFTDDITPLPGAKFWIPSLDEWMKAAHYDPNRFGEGEGGWWRFGHSSDEPPVPGLPGDPGAQTSAGARFELLDTPTVGAFPDAASPWGLLDVSGGARELISSWYEEVGNLLVLEGQQGGFSLLSPNPDDISFFGFGDPAGRIAGLRIAAAVPAPGVLCTLTIAIGAFGAVRRRRHRDEDDHNQVHRRMPRLRHGNSQHECGHHR